MKQWLIFGFMTAICFTSSSQPGAPSYSYLGDDLIGRRGIFGYVIEVENKRFDQIEVDTMRMLIQARLTGVTKDGVPTMWRSRRLAVYDAASLQMKWSKNFPGTEIILMTQRYMTFSQWSAHSLDVNTGKDIWKISPTLWYLDDQSDIGLSTDGKRRIQGVDLRSGKIIWEREVGKTFSGRNSTMLNDSTLLFNDMGLQTLNFRTGEGWIYDATSMSKYRDAGDVVMGTFDVLGALAGVAPVGGNKHVVRNVNSNVIVDDDVIYVAHRDRISCVTKKGKLLWARFFSKDTAAMMSTSSLVIKGERLYLINEGHAEVNFSDTPYGKPFLASFSLDNGSMRFLKKFAYEEPIKAFRPTDSSFVILTKNSISEFRLKDGSRIGFKTISKEEPALEAFAAEDLFFRSDDDTTHFGQIIAGDNKHYVVNEKQGLTVFDEELAELGKVPPGAYFTTWLDYKGFRFIGNTRKTVVIDRNGKAMAILKITTKSGMKGGRIYAADGNKLTVIKMVDVIPEKYKHQVK